MNRNLLFLLPCQRVLITQSEVKKSVKFGQLGSGKQILFLLSHHQINTFPGKFCYRQYYIYLWKSYFMRLGKRRKATQSWQKIKCFWLIYYIRMLVCGIMDYYSLSDLVSHFLMTLKAEPKNIILIRLLLLYYVVYIFMKEKHKAMKQ